MNDPLAVRGVMLDLGRRYWELDYLRAFIPRIAALGYNRLQLHLTEWNAFRLRLPDYEGLAAERSYTPEEINDLVRLAAGHGVEVVPEIDLPAHATAIIRYHPELRFTGPGAEHFNDGAYWHGSPTDGWTMDITGEANRDWIKGLLAAFTDALETPAVHLGGDEWPIEPGLSACAALNDHARSLDPAYTAGDALVAFMNELAGVVRSRGRRPEMWNWWERASGGDFRLWPDRDIRIVAWDTDEERLAWFLRHGYEVVASPSATHYVTPRTAPGNLAGKPYVAADPRRLYEDWRPAPGPLGYQLCVWADWAEQEPDAYFESYLRRPLEVLGARFCGPPAFPDADAFLTELDRVPGEVRLGAGRVTRVRFRPHAPEGGTEAGRWSAPVAEALDAVRGTRFQGARTADGPWEDLAVVTAQPYPVWNELPLSGEFAALRVVDAPEGLEVEWWGVRSPR
ncbi:family 20 glycosylhydrolase [Nonomuraea sp. NPDC050310]|uniref:family 20 glycosylhydrolase n=1 Tax=Nonomuraea sp. NPDC050310 TaxID=3154935 RepID=UPI0033E4B498